jgi:hypothetical protein
MPSLSRFVWFALSALSALLPAGAFADADWKLAKETEGIRIYTRAVPGAEIRQLRAEARIRSTVERLLRTYLDVERHTAWYPGCIAARLVRRDSGGRLIFYHRIDNPWPVQDRDYAFAVDTAGTDEQGGMVARYQDVAGQIPETEGCVRMRKLAGYWKFVPESDGFVAVTYVFDFDPGVGAPAAFINMSLPKIGHDMIKGLVRGAETAVAGPGGTSGAEPIRSGRDE